jgi:hypothetical protein
MNRRMILAGLPLAIATPALAQQRERRGPNGGLLAGSDGHEVELVANGTAIRVYLVNHGRVLVNHGRVAPPRSGATARLVIQEGQASRTANLAASGDGFSATLETPIASGARVVVTGRMPDVHTVQARYVMP